MIGEIIYDDEDIKMLESVLLLLEDDGWKDKARQLKEFIDRMKV